MLLTSFAVYALFTVDRGYIASIRGTLKFTHASEAPRILKSVDTDHCVHLGRGDRLEVQEEGAETVFILDDRRIVLRGPSVFSVPEKPTNMGNSASRTLVQIVPTNNSGAGPEAFSLFAPRNVKNAVVGNIGLFRDGSLPISWVQDGQAKTVQVTVQIKDMPEMKLEPIPVTTGSVKGLPFGCFYSKPLGMYLQQHISLMTDQRVTLTVTDDKGRTSKTEWLMPRKSEFMRVMNAFAASSANAFDDLDYSIAMAEGGKGVKKVPSYPGIMAGLTIGYLAQHPDSYVGVKYLRSLAHTFEFVGIERSLSIILTERERPN